MIVLNVMLKQHNATEFLNVEGKTLVHIHEHLKHVYGNVAVDVSTVRHLVHHCGEALEGQSSLDDSEHACYPAVTPHNTC